MNNANNRVVKLWTKNIPDGETGVRDACGVMHQGPADAYGNPYMGTIGVMDPTDIYPTGTILYYADDEHNIDEWIVMDLEWSDSSPRCISYLCVRSGARFREVDAEGILQFRFGTIDEQDDIHKYGGIVVDYIRSFGSRKNKTYSLHFTDDPHLSRNQKIKISECHHHPDTIWIITSRCNNAVDDPSYFAIQQD